MLKIIANNQSVAYMAQALGISEAFIYRWKQRMKGEGKYNPSGQASDVLIENQRLLQQINQLETEREILERVGELRKVESHANFVSTHDQTVFETDRLSMGGNFAFFQS